MVEFNRFEQVNRLIKEEEFEDGADCIFYEDEPTCGGPSFLKDKEGRIHWVSCGKHAPLKGTYLRSLNEEEYVELLFENGKCVEYGLPRKKKLKNNY